MPKDPSQVFINTNVDPGITVPSGATGTGAQLYYPTDTPPSNTIINVIQYTMNNIGSPGQVLINNANVPSGDPELTYNADTNILTVETLNVTNLRVTNNANLGSVNSVKISGGVGNYFLKTDGTGNTSWSGLPATSWSSVTGKPSFATVATSGDFDDLSNVPSLATTSFVSNAIANVTFASLPDAPVLATVATSGAYNDLSNLPALKQVALSGEYDDLLNKPTIPNIANLATQSYVNNSIANVTYANLSGKPSFATVATSGKYEDLIYPVYSTESDLPDAGDNHGMFAHVHGTGHGYMAHAGIWVQLANTDDLSGITSYDQSLNTTDSVTFSSVSTDTINSTGLEMFTTEGTSGSIDIYTDWGSGGVEVWLKHNDGVEITTSDGMYQWMFDNAGNLTFPDGTIQNTAFTGVDFSGYATETYVSTQIANLVSSSPAALNTLNELANALGNDASFSTTVSTALGNRLRVDTNAQGLSGTQQQNGRQNLGLATIASSGSYSDLSGAPTTWPGANVTGQVSYAATANSVAWANVSGKPTFATVATSGSYNDLTNKPTIPSFDQDLNTTNDVQFANVTLTGKVIAQQASGTDGGYSFGGDEGGNDTGMFSASDGVLDLYSNNEKIVTITTDSVQLNRNITSDGLEIYTNSGSGGSIDIYTDWTGGGTSGGLDLWLVHGDGVYVKTDDGNHIWKFDNTGKLQLPAGGDIVDSTGTSVLGGGSSFSGSYNDLTNKPTIPDGTYANLTGKPTFATVATSGSYNDLTNKPTINADRITNGSYSLVVQPQGHVTIPTSQYSTAQLFSQAGVTLYVGTLDNDNYWQFQSDKKLKLPPGGDIVDSTGTSVLGGGSGGISLTDLSVGSDNPASGSGGLSYNNGTGVFTFTPPDLSGYVTGTPWTLEGYVTGTPWTLEGYVTGSPWTMEGYLTSETQADWAESATESPAYIQNKPTIPTDIADLTDNTNLLSSNPFNQDLDTSDTPTFNGMTLDGKIIAKQASGTTGGYSFGGTEGGNDTGMFSSADGILDFYSNNEKIVTINAYGANVIGTINTDSIKIGGDLNYVDSANLISVEDKNGFGQVLFQNKNSGQDASMNIVLVNDSPGIDYMAIGINSSTFSPLYDTLFELPNAGYISHTVDTVIGPQSSHSDSSRVYLTYNSGSNALELNENGAIGWGASYVSGTLTEGNFGTVGQVLTSNGPSSAPSWTTVSGGGGGFSGSYNDLTNKPTLFSGSYNDLTNKPTLFSGSYNDLTNKPTIKAEPSFVIETSNFNAESGSRYGVNTTSGVVTATLPSSPTAGDAIYFVDAGGAYATNNLTVDPNGGTIMDASGSLTVSVDNQNFGLMYNGTTWRVY